MKIKKVFPVSLWILFWIQLIPNISCAGEIPCNRAVDVVRVTVKQENEFPPTYSYVIKNLRKSPIAIKSIALGDSDHEEMYSVQDNIPKNFVSPEGWESGISYTDESVFMRIFWKTKDSTVIAPRGSFGGFKVELPQPVMKKGEVHYLYGKPIEVFDMKKAPFNILLGDGACLWGRVQESGKLSK